LESKSGLDGGVIVCGNTPIRVTSLQAGNCVLAAAEIF